MGKPLLVLVAFVLLLCRGWMWRFFITLLGEDSVDEYEVTVDNHSEPSELQIDVGTLNSMESVEAVIDCGRYGSGWVTFRCLLSQRNVQGEF